MDKLLIQALEIAALKEPASNFNLVRTAAQQKEIDDHDWEALETADRLGRNRDADSDWG